jgi:hypothetical protein
MQHMCTPYSHISHQLQVPALRCSVLWSSSCMSHSQWLFADTIVAWPPTLPMPFCAHTHSSR